MKSNLFVPARITDYIRPIGELKPGEKVVLICRVSNCERSDHLPESESELRREATARGLIVVGVYSYVRDGRQPDFYPAILLAEEHGATALLAETVDRFKRPDTYRGPKTNHHPLLEWDLRPLRHLPVRLFTLEDPDATPGKNRSRQSIRGQTAKGKKGGRPIKGRDAYRHRWLPTVHELHGQGMSLRAIVGKLPAREGGRKPSVKTIWAWLKRPVSFVP